MLSKNGVLVLQGDSITDSGRFDDPEDLGRGYPGMVARYLRNFYPDLSMTVYNRGISGSRSGDLVKRWDADCLDLKPTVVSILIGINDTWYKFANNAPTSAEEYIKNCEILMKRTKDAGASLIILEPFTFPMGVVTPEWRIDLDPKINGLRNLAAKYADAYIPLDGIFRSLSVETAPEIWSTDGVHLQPAGHRTVAKELIKVLER